MSKPTSVPYSLSLITKPYTQTLLASLDKAYDIKIALLEGPYIWHSHPNNDEAFYVISGELLIDTEISNEELGNDGTEGAIVEGEKEGVEAEEGQEKEQGRPEGRIEQVKMKTGDLYVAKRGVRHRPVGKAAQVMVIEKKGVLDGQGGLAQPIVADRL